MALEPGMYNVEGLEKLLSNLDRLPVQLQKKGLSAAVRKSANVIRDAARANALALDDPATAAKIWKNIVVQSSTRLARKNGGVAMRIGVLGGASNYADTKQNRRMGRVGQKYQTGGKASNPGGDTWYWRFFEFGSETVQQQPLLRSAARKSGQAALDVLQQELSKQIAKLELL